MLFSLLIFHAGKIHSSVDDSLVADSTMAQCVTMFLKEMNCSLNDLWHILFVVEYFILQVAQSEIQSAQKLHAFLRNISIYSK